MALTTIEVKNAKPGRHSDGSGLYLMGRPSGSSSWLLRAQRDGKRHDFGLGSTAAVSLAHARAKAAALRAQLKAGEEVRPAIKPVKPATPTFSEAARACHMPNLPT